MGTEGHFRITQIVVQVCFPDGADDCYFSEKSRLDDDLVLPSTHNWKVGALMEDVQHIVSRVDTAVLRAVDFFPANVLALGWRNHWLIVGVCANGSGRV